MRKTTGEEICTEGMALPVEKHDGCRITMGNRTNRDSWAGRERLRFVERSAWWAGEVNRSDLSRVFGISAAQASADLQTYQEINGGALAYNKSRKCYEGQAGMRCVLHEPRLAEAVSVFLEGGESVRGLSEAGDGGLVGRVVTPAREPRAGVARRVFLAVVRRQRVRVRYWSVNSGSAAWRWIVPHALGHDGYRWHVRAWCEWREGFRDFVLARMERADWPEFGEDGGVVEPPEVDEDWEAWETLVLRASSKLNEAERRAIELDYGMKGGRLRYRVRKAMLRYAADHLRLSLPGMEALPTHLEVE